MNDEIELHGWTAVPRDPKVFLSKRSKNKEPEPLLIDDLPFPIDELVTKVQEFAKSELREETYNHSMRVYYFGNPLVLLSAAKYQQLPSSSH